MKGFVYILKDRVGKFYIGSTPDPKKRIKQHSYGYTATTSRMTEPRMVLCQEYTSLLETRRIERRLKNLKRKDYIEKIVKDGYIKMVNPPSSFKLRSYGT